MSCQLKIHLSVEARTEMLPLTLKISDTVRRHQRQLPNRLSAGDFRKYTFGNNNSNRLRFLDVFGIFESWIYIYTEIDWDTSQKNPCQVLTNYISKVGSSWRSLQVSMKMRLEMISGGGGGGEEEGLIMMMRITVCRHNVTSGNKLCKISRHPYPQLLG